MAYGRTLILEGRLSQCLERILRSPVLCARHLSNYAASKNYYEVLGVDKTSTAKDIKSKYVELCKQYHPDRVSSGDAKELEKNKKKFQDVQEAYNVLSRESDRKHYDDDLKYGFNTSPGYDSGYRTYQGGPRRAYYYRDQSKEQAYYEFRNRRSNPDAEGWSWGSHYEEPYDSRREEFNAYRRRMWEQQQQDWSKQANDPRAQSASRFSIVSFCIILMMSSLLLEMIRGISLSESYSQEERRRIMRDVRRSRVYEDLTEEEKRRFIELTLDRDSRYGVRR